MNDLAGSKLLAKLDPIVREENTDNARAMRQTNYANKLQTIGAKNCKLSVSST